MLAFLQRITTFQSFHQFIDIFGLQISTYAKILSILCVLCFSSTINAQKAKTSQDSIHIFYDRLFSVMEDGYLYKCFSLKSYSFRPLIINDL